jgi:probable HAF family extracellular repeat protein
MLAVVAFFFAALQAHADPVYTYLNFGSAVPQSINSAGDVVLQGPGNYNGVYQSYGPDAGQITPPSAYGIVASSAGSQPVLTGITNSGAVFGQVSVGNTTQGFIAIGGQVTYLGGSSPGYSSMIPQGANASGVVVGYSNSLSAWGGQALVFQGGQVTNLGTLGGPYAGASAINNAGQIVGTSYPSADSPPHAFLYQNGKMTDLGTLGGTQIGAFGINDQGQVVGSSSLAGPIFVEHAFLYSNGKMTDLGTLPGTTFSEATAINDSSQIVGDSGTHAVLWQNGNIYDLNSFIQNLPPYTSVVATGINNLGQIIGYTLNGQDQFTGFLLTPSNLPAAAFIPPDPEPVPAPEPGTLLIFGLMATVGIIRHQYQSLIGAGRKVGNNLRLPRGSHPA